MNPPATFEEEGLLARYYGCEVAAFDLLEPKLREFLVNALLRRVRQGQYILPRGLSPTQAAAGLVLDVLQKVYETKGHAQFDPARGSLRTWILTILDRYIIDRGRRADGRLGATPDNLESDPTEEPFEAATTDELERALGEALASLTPEERQLIEAVYFTGRPQNEVAVERRISPSALNKQLGRIHARLVEWLAERGHRAALEELAGGIKGLLGAPRRADT